MSPRLVSRLAEIALGYAAACLAAGITSVAAYLVVVALGAAPRRSIGIELVVPVVLLVAVWGGLLAAVPGALVIALAERRRVRSARIYAGSGVAIAGAAYLIYLAAGSDFDPRTMTAALGMLASPMVWLAAIALFGSAGLVGGLVYHRVAGRNAGC